MERRWATFRSGRTFIYLDRFMAAKRAVIGAVADAGFTWVGENGCVGRSGGEIHRWQSRIVGASARKIRRAYRSPHRERAVVVACHRLFSPPSRLTHPTAHHTSPHVSLILSSPSSLTSSTLAYTTLPINFFFSGVYPITSHLDHFLRTRLARPPPPHGRIIPHRHFLCPPSSPAPGHARSDAPSPVQGVQAHEDCRRFRCGLRRYPRRQHPRSGSS